MKNISRLPTCLLQTKTTHSFCQNFFEHLSDFHCDDIIIGGYFNLVINTIGALLVTALVQSNVKHGVGERKLAPGLPKLRRPRRTLGKSSRLRESLE